MELPSASRSSILLLHSQISEGVSEKLCCLLWLLRGFNPQLKKVSKSEEGIMYTKEAFDFGTN